MIMYVQGPSPPPDIDEKFDQFEDTVEPRVPIKNHHTPSQSSSLPDLSPFAGDTDEKSRTLVALHDFQDLEQDDLSFKAGDVVNVLRPQSAAPSSYFVSALWSIGYTSSLEVL
jgi:SH3 domain